MSTPIRKKRILYVITKSNFGGAQRYVYELVTGLPQDTFEVAVACGGNGVLKTKLADAHITTFTVDHFERDIDIKKEILAMRELAHIIRTFKPDVVHLNSSKAGGSGALIARMLGVSHIIFTAHGWAFCEDRSWVWKSVVWLLSWITGLLSHTIIPVSAYDYAHTPKPFLQKKSTLIKTALPQIQFFERTTARNILFPHHHSVASMNALWAVSTGELTLNKNISFLLHALAVHNNSTSEHRIFLTLIGDGEEREHLMQLTHTLGISEYVTFTGFIENARIYLKAFDLFILPSLKEGMPYGLLEAGAAGLPVIASRVGGIPEIITHTQNGLLIDPHQQSSLTEALYTYATQPTLRAQHSTALKEKVTTECTLEKMLRETIVVYNNTY